MQNLFSPTRCWGVKTLAREGRRGKAVARTLLSGQKAQDALEKICESRAASVDDARFFERRKLLGRAIERLVRGAQHACDETVKLRFFDREFVGCIGGGIGDR